MPAAFLTAGSFRTLAKTSVAIFGSTSMLGMRNARTGPTWVVAWYCLGPLCEQPRHHHPQSDHEQRDQPGVPPHAPAQDSGDIGSLRHADTPSSVVVVTAARSPAVPARRDQAEAGAGGTGQVRDERSRVAARPDGVRLRPTHPPQPRPQREGPAAPGDEGGLQVPAQVQPPRLAVALLPRGRERQPGGVAVGGVHQLDPAGLRDRRAAGRAADVGLDDPAARRSGSRASSPGRPGRGSPGRRRAGSWCRAPPRCGTPRRTHWSRCRAATAAPCARRRWRAAGHRRRTRRCRSTARARRRGSTPGREGTAPSARPGRMHLEERCRVGHPEPLGPRVREPRRGLVGRLDHARVADRGGRGLSVGPVAQDLGPGHLEVVVRCVLREPHLVHEQLDDGVLGEREEVSVLGQSVAMARHGVHRGVRAGEQHRRPLQPPGEQGESRHQVGAGHRRLDHLDAGVGARAPVAPVGDDAVDRDRPGARGSERSAAR